MEAAEVKPKALIEAVTERVTLNVFRIGSEKINYQILKSLPSTITNLEKKFGLTKMPMNKRVNELAEVGLLSRDKYTGKVNPTDLTQSFIEIVEELKQEIIKELPKLI